MWRCLNFLASTSKEAVITIADSSDDEVFKKNAVSISTEFSKLNISHVDCRGMSILNKYSFALQKIKTPFVVPCGDDDFLIYKSAWECAEFLQSNEDYSHAHGNIVTFWETLSGTSPISRIKIYPQSENARPAPARLFNHFNNYHNNFYSVHRTHLLNKNIKEITALDTSMELKERALAALDIFFGKRKMLNGLFILRQKGITGMDEKGRKTLVVDANNRASLHSSTGFFTYLKFLIDHIDSIPDADEVQKSRIVGTVISDYEKWQLRKRPAKQVHGIRKIFLRAYFGINRLIDHFLAYQAIKKDTLYYNKALKSLRDFRARIIAINN